MLFLCTQDLKEDGYDVGEVPEDESALMQSVLNDPEAKYNSADLNVAYKMSVDEYQRLCPFASALEENWGKPPGWDAPACPSCTDSSDHVCSCGVLETRVGHA